MIQEEEDSKFIDTLNEIVADNAAEQAVSVATPPRPTPSRMPSPKA